MSELTQSYLKEALHYNPKTGEFTWNVRPRSHFRTDRGLIAFNCKFAGKPAGCKQTPKRRRSSYIHIKINNKTHYAHRLAWLYMFGEWPENHIDHIDGNGLNNRLENLRDVSNRGNSMNQKTPLNNTSGVKGVYWNKECKKWRARIMINGKSKSLGYHTTLEAAAAARAAAALEHGYTTPEVQ